MAKPKKKPALPPGSDLWIRVSHSEFDPYTHSYFDESCDCAPMRAARARTRADRALRKKFYAIDIQLHDKTKVVGRASIWREELPNVGPVVRIEGVSLKPEYRGRGLGTKLYEKAARVACEELGFPLTSMGERTAMSEGFWQKQHAKGRATRIETGKILRNRKKQVAFMLSCPAPTSLKGVRRGR